MVVVAAAVKRRGLECVDVIAPRDSHVLFRRAGITVPTLHELNGSSLKYPDDLHIFSGCRISGRPANPICTPIELLRSDAA